MITETDCIAPDLFTGNLVGSGNTRLNLTTKPLHPSTLPHTLLSLTWLLCAGVRFLHCAINDFEEARCF